MDDTFLDFKSGAFVLSEKTGIPIVPIYIYGAKEILPRAEPFTRVKPGALKRLLANHLLLKKVSLQSFSSGFVLSTLKSLSHVDHRRLKVRFRPWLDETSMPR